MAPDSSPRHATPVLLDDEPDISLSATCPMCHTSTSVTKSAIEAGGAWRCVRCGQHWDAARLAAVAAYTAWDVDPDRRGRRGTEGSHDTAPSCDLPPTRLDGKS